MKLAINGGSKVRTKLFPRYISIGEEEEFAVQRVMRGGVLSRFLGCWDDDFYGGEEVRSFEHEWAERFKVKHAISVNSNSSGLQAALGACGIGYGDEVIVSPYSMSVSATAPLVWNATPVFADISEENFCLDPVSVRQKITEKTKAIVVVHLFGCPADMDEIMAIAKEFDLYVIEDAAQCPGAMYKNQLAGTIGDVGVFSLNYHKHIHTGEGGVCVTNNDRLAKRMQLIRNHAEAVVEGMQEADLTNMLGFNFRMTELQAAIGREQLKKLDREVLIRQKYAKTYNDAFKQFPQVEVHEPKDRTHAYYGQAFKFADPESKVINKRFVEAVKAELMPVQGREAEGVPIGAGYVKPLYLLPMFQHKQAYKDGFPFNGNENYAKGLCPVVEKMHYESLWVHDLTRSPLSEEDIQSVVDAYVKVLENIEELKNK